MGIILIELLIFDLIVNNHLTFIQCINDELYSIIPTSDLKYQSIFANQQNPKLITNQNRVNNQIQKLLKIDQDCEETMFELIQFFYPHLNLIYLIQICTNSTNYSKLSFDFIRQCIEQIIDIWKKITYLGKFKIYFLILFF